jgi:hypothetical protein
MNQLGQIIPIVALLIPIVAIVMVNWRRVKLKELELVEKGAIETNAEQDARVQRLEERIAVLERIATDRRHALSDEIDRLGR